MLCFQCGTKVGGDASKCTNCGVALRTEKKLELSTSRGLRISQEMKAIRIDQQVFPPGEYIDDRYKLGEMIGKGPLGEVYRAFDEVIGSDIAIKLFKKELIENPHDQDTFLRNMDKARKETSENLVRIHSSGVHKDHPWVASQLLEGLSLRKVISLRIKKNEKFEVSELDAVLSQIQSAIETKSDNLHGNLKPENIVFLPDTLKITDGFLFDVFSAKSIKTYLKDSPYLAPEYADLTIEKEPSADVYSVGVIVSEMLLGSQYREGQILPTRITPAADHIIKKATDKNPQNRYATIAQVRDAFKKISGTQVVPPPPPSNSAGASQNTPMVNVSSDDLPTFADSALLDPSIDADTVEYDRRIDSEIQNYIPTTEVKRTNATVEKDRVASPPASPKPSETESKKLAPIVPIGKANENDEKSFPILPVLAVVLGVLVLVFLAFKPDKPIDLGKGKITQLEKNELKVEEKVAEVTKLPENTVEKTEVQTIAQAEKKLENTTIIAPIGETDIDEKTIPSMFKGAKSELADRKKIDPKKEVEKNPIDTSKTVAKRDDSKVEEVEVPPGTKCPKGLKLKKRKWGNYCIARYEYPGAGSKPKTRVSWFAAKKLCEARDQRLCKKKEWRSACGSTYPYGKTFDANKCNSVDEDGFDRWVARAGSFRGCKKGGVYDLVGNVHEWTQEQKIVGGGFESDESVASCRYASSKSPGSSAGYIGFRCCADPE